LQLIIYVYVKVIKRICEICEKIRVIAGNQHRDLREKLNMNEVLLTLENVSCLYGERIILQDLSLGIHTSEKIGIVGINGSGKTSLLRIISGLIKPATGTVTSVRT
jgi:ABC-type molybdenum transport system ATPase subunit/photorepair protein PhrA